MGQGQASLFSPDEGERLKEDGIERVRIHNEFFVETMRRWAREHCSVSGTITIDDLRERAGRMKMRPTHPNAWGAVFKGEAWECVGYTKSRLETSHARLIRVWRMK